jgi:hypothetical protein
MEEPVYRDDKLRELIRHTGISSPGDQFTDKLMNRIRQEPVPEESLSRTLLPRRTWWLLAAGFVLVIVVVFFFNWSIFDLNPKNINVERYEQLIPAFQSIVNSFRNISGFLTNSSLPLIIGIGIVSLLVVDRLVRKLTLGKSFII